MSKKTKLYIAATGICLCLIGLVLYPTAKKETLVKNNKKTEVTPMPVIEKFMNALIANETLEMLDYLTTTTKETVIQNAKSTYEGLITFMDIPQAPQTYEITDITYNKQIAQAIVKLSYQSGFLRRKLHLENSNSWKINDVETIDTWWVYQNLQQNIEFRYPMDWVLQQNSIGTQISWTVKDLSDYPSITFIIMDTDLPEALTNLLNCQTNKDVCETVEINETKFSKTTKSNLTPTETLTTLTTAKNSKTYITIGITQTQNAADELKLLDEVLSTVTIQ